MSLCVFDMMEGSTISCNVYALAVSRVQLPQPKTLTEVLELMLSVSVSMPERGMCVMGITGRVCAGLRGRRRDRWRYGSINLDDAGMCGCLGKGHVDPQTQKFSPATHCNPRQPQVTGTGRFSRGGNSMFVAYAE